MTDSSPDHLASLPVHGGQARATVRHRLREKLPEILLEAASVVVAVLLAFGVDEWRDARAKRELADRAQRSVLAEIRANREELRGVFAVNAKQLESMQRTLDFFDAHPDAKDASVTLGFHAAQLSVAAWDAARTTQAAQLLPFEWVVDVARVYETQELYRTAQLDMLQRTRAAVAAFATAKKDSPEEIVAPLRSELETFQSLGEQLGKRYDSFLARAHDKP
jgi:hypothetical protein